MKPELKTPKASPLRRPTNLDLKEVIMKKATLKSTFLAVALTFATAAGLTAGQAVIYPDTAQAGIVSSVKNAAKKVGGAVKTTAKGIGSAAKAGGAAGKQIGVGVGKSVV